jgi:sulfur-carrier protein
MVPPDGLPYSGLPYSGLPCSGLPLATAPIADSIEVCVKLFAIYQDRFGVPDLQLTLPAGATVDQVLDRLIEAQPSLANWRSVTRFGVNLQFVEPSTLLQSGDEVVLIPPVSGG